MAWIEKRRRKFVPHDRVGGQRVKGPSFDSREEARLFLKLVDHVGWTAACEDVLTPEEGRAHPRGGMRRRGSPADPTGAGDRGRGDR